MAPSTSSAEVTLPDHGVVEVRRALDGLPTHWRIRVGPFAIAWVELSYGDPLHAILQHQLPEDAGDELRVPYNGPRTLREDTRVLVGMVQRSNSLTATLTIRTDLG